MHKKSIDKEVSEAKTPLTTVTFKSKTTCASFMVMLNFHSGSDKIFCIRTKDSVSSSPTPNFDQNTSKRPLNWRWRVNASVMAVPWCFRGCSFCSWRTKDSKSSFQIASWVGTMNGTAENPDMRCYQQLWQSTGCYWIPYSQRTTRMYCSRDIRICQVVLQKQSKSFSL